MRNIREVQRLRLGADLSVRQISICTKFSLGSIQKPLKSAQALGIV
ncbi:putative transcriptional regulator [Aeromonas hydrophila]|nr:putative transcriptional regulator [Aeromonas hydrophila]